ncbi:glycine cleavage system protein GcvH [Haloglomus litoreum]|uniref:glycine cleavage system protein GcvH n=1 Tax=Haloglomus litoreum TaxID=3034026 RepID=UPI0023E75A9A|nr:glycine cleavage system protein GcvH [Haloglomus sp. DT116]
MFDVPADRRYAESHEWALETDGTVRVGISDFAQDELGDIVFVELPDVGQAFAAGDAFGLVESIKAVSDLYTPVEGEVVATNDALLDAPELLNEDPYGDGWLVELGTDASLDGLLSPEAYREQIE